MNERKENHPIRMFFVIVLCAMVLSGCQNDEEVMLENTVTGEHVLEDRQECPLDELFDYLNEAGEGIPYAYAQIIIAVSDSAGKEAEEGSDDELFRQDAIKMEGTAEVLWNTFQTEEEFQEYFNVKEQEDWTLSGKEDYEAAFVYYQYPLGEDVHAIDIDGFLKERYDEEDNPIYAITLDGARKQNSDCFNQSGIREIVVLEDRIYGLECKDISDTLMKNDFDASEILMAYSIQKQGAEEPFYRGWVMSEETLYWVDHDERVSSMENPVRTFTEVRGIDSSWDSSRYIENFALLKEADYQTQLCKDGPMMRLHFSFAEEASENGYETELLNGFCMDESYEMTVTNLDTNELLQIQNVQLSIELPDMITFVDLNQDGYLDMQIDEPTHWSGMRAVVDEYAGQFYMLWNPEEQIFELTSDRQRAESLQSGNESEQKEWTDFAEYVVQPGDTLWGIARRFYGTGTRYLEIERENAKILNDYEYLMPGMALKIPAPTHSP